MLPATEHPTALIVTAEVYPLAKTGGLADAVGGLAQALIAQGVGLHVLLPCYRIVRSRVKLGRRWRLDGLPGGTAHLLEAQCLQTELPCLLLDSPALFDREGIYVDEAGCDYPDNPVRFAALCHAAAAIAAGLPGLERPRIVHAQDWHTGLAPLLVRHAAPQARTIMTIHNLSFQGSFSMDEVPALGLPAGAEHDPRLYAWDRLNFLKAGIALADSVSTVSRHYAQEILTPEGGCGLHEALRARALDFMALPNGIDTAVWNPRHDVHLADGTFDIRSLNRKAYWKSRVQQAFGLRDTDSSFLVISCCRLTEQKMVDVTLKALPEALDRLPTLQFAVLGQGEKRFERGFIELAQRYPGRCAIQVGYHEAVAHRMQAGADALWHPSRFEPFGLTPLYAMQYGTLPLVTAVGGMVDTIHDPGPADTPSSMVRANGFHLEAGDPPAMVRALQRAETCHTQPPVWQAMQRNAMRAEHGWSHAVRSYLTLYSRLCGQSFAGEAQRRPASARFRMPPHTRRHMAHLPLTHGL